MHIAIVAQIYLHRQAQYHLTSAMKKRKNAIIAITYHAPRYENLNESHHRNSGHDRIRCSVRGVHRMGGRADMTAALIHEETNE